MKELQVPNGQGLNLAGINPGTAARNAVGDYGMMQGKALQNVGAHAQAAVMEFGKMRDAGAIMDIESKLIDMQDRYDKEIMKGLSLANNHPESLFDVNGMLNETRLNSIVSKYQLEVKNLKTGMWLPDNALKTDEMKNRFASSLAGRGTGMAFKQQLRNSRDVMGKRMALAQAQGDYMGQRRINQTGYESGLIGQEDYMLNELEINQNELIGKANEFMINGNSAGFLEAYDNGEFDGMTPENQQKTYAMLMKSLQDNRVKRVGVREGKQAEVLDPPPGISEGLVQLWAGTNGKIETYQHKAKARSLLIAQGKQMITDPGNFEQIEAFRDLGKEFGQSQEQMNTMIEMITDPMKGMAFDYGKAIDLAANEGAFTATLDKNIAELKQKQRDFITSNGKSKDLTDVEKNTLAALQDERSAWKEHNKQKVTQGFLTWQEEYRKANNKKPTDIESQLKLVDLIEQADKWNKYKSPITNSRYESIEGLKTQTNINQRQLRLNVDNNNGFNVDQLPNSVSSSVNKDWVSVNRQSVGDARLFGDQGKDPVIYVPEGTLEDGMVVGLTMKGGEYAEAVVKTHKDAQGVTLGKKIRMLLGGNAIRMNFDDIQIKHKGKKLDASRFKVNYERYQQAGLLPPMGGYTEDYNVINQSVVNPGDEGLEPLPSI